MLYDDSIYKEQDIDIDGMAVLTSEGTIDALETKEKQEMLLEQVERLPEKSRAVIHLFYYEEMSVKEIANSLGITEQNVKTRLSRARDQLREIMGGKRP